MNGKFGVPSVVQVHGNRPQTVVITAKRKTNELSTSAGDADNAVVFLSLPVGLYLRNESLALS